MAENARRAAGRKDQPHQKLQRRRFAGAVRSEKTKDLALLNIERQAVERTHLALAPKADFVIFRQILNLDYRHDSKVIRRNTESQFTHHSSLTTIVLALPCTGSDRRCILSQSNDKACLTDRADHSSLDL